MGFDLLAEVRHAEWRDNMIEFLEKLGVILDKPQENFGDEELVNKIKNKLDEMLGW